MQGLLYVLYNPSMAGLVKIGKTTRTSEERAQELSNATGVPTPFLVVYEARMENIDEAEQLAHQQMQDLGFHRNKEFFHAPIKAAVFVVEDIKWKSQPQKTHFTHSHSTPETAGVLQEARRYHHGTDGTIPDLKKATKLYRQISNWSKDACRALGDLELERNSRASSRKAMEYYVQAIQLGEEELLMEVIEHHISLDEWEIAERYLRAYERSSVFSEEEMLQFLVNHGINSTRYDPKFKGYFHIQPYELTDFFIKYKPQLLDRLQAQCKADPAPDRRVWRDVLRDYFAYFERHKNLRQAELDQLPEIENLLDAWGLQYND